MRASLTRSVAWGAAILAIAAAAPSRPACAGDAPPDRGAPASSPRPQGDPVAQLTADELETVRRLTPDWDRLEPAQRDRIARFVLRVRSLSPEQRRSFEEKMRRLGEAGPGAVEEFVKKILLVPEGERERKPVLAQLVVARAVATGVIGRLPDPAKAALAVGTNSPFPERSPLDFSIATAWKKHVVDALAAAPPLPFEPPTWLKPEQQKALTDQRDALVQAGGAAAPEKERRAFAQRVWELGVHGAKRAAESVTTPGSPTPPVAGGGPSRYENRERLAEIARRLDAAFPGSFDAVATELSSAVGKGRPGIDEFVAKNRPVDARAGERERIAMFFRDLEKARVAFVGISDVRDGIDDLEARLLRAAHVPEDRIRELRSAMGPQRFLLLHRIGEEFGIPLGSFGRGGPGRRGGKGEPPPAMGDGGMSDASMADGAMDEGK